MLLENGRADRRALRREAMTSRELLSQIRESGFDDLEDVALVVLETNGHISVMGRAAADRWRTGH